MIMIKSSIGCVELAANSEDLVRVLMFFTEIATEIQIVNLSCQQLSLPLTTQMR